MRLINGALALLLVVLACAGVARAQIPASVEYQGALFTSDGKTIDGTFQLRFEVYTAQTGGTPSVTLDASSVTVTKGSFSVDVGMLFTTLSGTDLFLAVSVKGANDSDYDVLPRVRIASVPYALHSGDTDSVDWTHVKNAPSLLQGPSGPAGVQGPIGPAGPSPAPLVGTTLDPGDSNCPTGGTKYVVGNNTAYVCNGARGPTGSIGPTGATGAGVAGPTGAVGPTGAQGASGPVGATGAGVSGPTGAVGATGPQGSSGPVGPTGVVGASGTIGPSGAQGASGPQGPVGATGSVGPTGPAGPSGAVGASGSQGDPGFMGPSGPIGLTGSSGATGDPGPTGPSGPTGVSGLNGATGPTGVGVAGPSGPAGTTARVVSAFSGFSNIATTGNSAVFTGDAPQFSAIPLSSNAANGTRYARATPISTPVTITQISMYVTGTGTLSQFVVTPQIANAATGGTRDITTGVNLSTGLTAGSWTTLTLSSNVAVASGEYIALKLVDGNVKSGTASGALAVEVLVQ